MSDDYINIHWDIITEGHYDFGTYPMLKAWYILNQSTSHSFTSCTSSEARYPAEIWDAIEAALAKLTAKDFVEFVVGPNGLPEGHPLFNVPEVVAFAKTWE